MKGTRLTAISAAIALVLLAALIVPLLALAPYDAPQCDDFLYGKDVERAWDATHSVPAAFLAGVDTAARLYREWQGTYTATFLMAMHPGVWAIPAYRATPFIMIGSLLFGLWLFTWVVGKRVLKCTAMERLFLFALTGILCTQFLPSPVQGFYWFNGAIFYTFYFALALVFLALLAAFCYRTRGQKRNAAYYILLPLIAAFLAGGNYSTCLMLALLLSAFVIWRFINKRRELLPLITLLIFLALFAASLLAPGNALHRTQDGGLSVAVIAGVKAMAKALRSIIRWTTLPVLVAAALSVPVAWRFAGRTDPRFRYPWLLAAASFLWLASGFMPTLYTQDYTGSDRLLDIQFYAHILLLIVNVFYCTGWLRRQVPAENTDIAPRAKRAAALALALITLAVCLGSYDAFSSVEAAKSLLSGEAAGYKAEFDARTAVLEDPAVTDAILPPLHHRPRLLLIEDYSQSPDGELNLVVGGSYYEKNSLRIDPALSW